MFISILKSRFYYSGMVRTTEIIIEKIICYLQYWLKKNALGESCELSFTGGNSPGKSSQELLQSGWGKVSTLSDFNEGR